MKKVIDFIVNVTGFAGFGALLFTLFVSMFGSRISDCDLCSTKGYNFFSIYITTESLNSLHDYVVLPGLSIAIILAFVGAFVGNSGGGDDWGYTDIDDGE